MGKGFETICVVVLLNCNILAVAGEGDESNEEAQPSYEYIQIFRSIPALFEYLLDALEERPEILEKNEVTMFKRDMDFEDTEVDKSEDSDSETKMDKREADYDCINIQDAPGGSNEVYKRDASTKDVTEATVAYEYGNSNFVMKGLDEIESNNIVSKRFANTDNFNEAINKNEMKTELLKRENMINHRKRSVLFNLADDSNDVLRNYGEFFFGFEHLFGLDVKPEEIEERIKTAENLLEEHHNKKQDK
ncbi:hypothetical protein PYW08_008415 [Mythimna loreyi]|uniref:Uncharacterized protein n=1 Tax=Mythimna loreyi TaxID=667449 RepID=A0ACC2QBV8_9NEOP|nr:hypothetical protein PYW08_008415 [Mythimna loreyi]